MPIIQTEGYIENPKYRFRRNYALSVGLKMKPKKKRFPVLRQKLTQILP